MHCDPLIELGTRLSAQNENLSFRQSQALSFPKSRFAVVFLDTDEANPDFPGVRRFIKFGVAGTAASIAGGAYAVTEINKTRDNNIKAISKEYLQITTLNPGDTTSGVFKANLPPAGKYPQEITFVVNIGSDRHTFKYTVAKSK